MYWPLCVLLASSAIAQSTPDPQNATVFSLLYGYPLLAWQKAYVPIIDGVGTNTWEHARILSTPSDKTVVKPNVDTLYSYLVYDLSQSNVEVTIPDVPATEFKLFSFYDPFGDNFANVGTGGFYKSGTYLIQPYDRPGGISAVGLQKNNESLGGYVANITTPIPYGLLLVRWGVNSTNVATVHGWQNECKSKVLAHTTGLTNSNSSNLTSLTGVYNGQHSPAENVMNLLAKYAPRNGPLDQFKAAGITNGGYTAVSSVNVTAANTTAVGMAAAAAANPNDINPENNGWSVLSPKYIGVYGTNYALRTLIAATGYLALANPYAVYPTWANTSSGSANTPLNVASDEAILFTFSGKPPLQEAGFWSLTAYGSDYFLIPNKEDIYEIGDRSNITYSNGTRVYGATPSSTSNTTAYQVLLQPADVEPPTNWTSNWLPAPSGGGDVFAQLRFFAAEMSLADGSYKFPVVEKIAAIKRGSGAAGGGNSTTAGGNDTATGAASSVRDVSGMPWMAVLVAMICLMSGTVAL